MHGARMTGVRDADRVPWGRWPRAAWSLLFPLLVLLPAAHFILLVAGILPTVMLMVLASRIAIRIMRRGTAEGYALLALLGGHLLVIALLLYAAGAGLSRLLFWAFAARLSGFLLAGGAGG